MAFDAGSVIVKIKTDITDFQDGIKNVEKNVSGFGDKMKSLTTGIADFGQKAAIVAGVAAGGFGLFLKSSVDEANAFNKSMTTLDIISGRFGISGQAAKDAAQQLGKELRIGVGPAAESLQNLFKSGLNLEQATDLMRRFTNEAITGKSPSISLADAVQNLSFAYTTNNSAIGNLSGISENFNDIIKRGRDALIAQGMSASEVTDDMAKYKGMIELTNLTLGSSEQFTGTLIDKQAQLDQKISELKVSVGLIAAEVITPFVGKLSEWVDAIGQWVTDNKATIEDWAKKASAAAQMVFDWIEKFVKFLIDNKEYVVAFFIVIAGAIAVWVGAMVVAHAGVIAIIAILTLLIGWIIKSKDQIVEFAASIVERFQAIVAGVTASFNLIVSRWNDLVGRLRDKANDVLDAIMWPFNEAKKRIEDAVNFIKDRLDFTQRHSPSVIDIINRSVRLANDAIGNLDFGMDVGNKAVIGAAATAPTGSGVIANITVDMAGAFISSEAMADELGERFGDSIIRKLQQNVRF